MASAALTIEWKDEYLVGVDIIDHEHKMLFSTFNDFAKAIENDLGDLIVERILIELLEYVLMHFEHEEDIMLGRNCNPDEYGAHKAEHEGFTKRLIAIKDRFDRGDNINAPLTTFLLDLILGHTVIRDIKLGTLV